MGINDNLVAHWKIDEGSGSTLTDSAGSNNASLSNGTWNGTDLEFNGSSTYANFTVNSGSDNDLVWGGTSQAIFSVAVLIEPDTVSGSETIYEHNFSEDIGCREQGFRLIRNGSNIQFRWYDTTQSLNNSVTTGGNLSVGVRSRVVVTRNGTTLKIYVDGVEESFTVSSADLDFRRCGGNDIANIGRWNDSFNGPTQYFDGVIKDLRLYSSELSSEDVASFDGGGDDSTNAIFFGGAF